MKNNELGKLGELIAKEYLLKNQFEIYEKNYRLGRLEIDMIGKKDSKIYFFEIKTRLYCEGCEKDFPLSNKQSVNLRKAAHIYCAKHGLSFDKITYDLILILTDYNLKRYYIRHYKNIF